MITGDGDDSDREESSPLHQLETSANMTDVMAGNFPIIHCHPESILNTKEGRDLLDNSSFTDRIIGVVIDECHKTDEW